MQHPAPDVLALYAGGDLDLWSSCLSGSAWPILRASMHIRRCPQCGSEVRALRRTLAELKSEALEMPAGLDWLSMSAEIRANIRLGLAAGAIAGEAAEGEIDDEAVPAALLSDGHETPAWAGSSRAAWPWQMGVVMASLVLVAVVSWILPAPEAGAGPRLAGWTARAPVFLEAQGEGLALQNDGSALTLLNPGDAAVTTTVSWDGGARASYVDSETGQVTIHHVSAQ